MSSSFEFDLSGINYKVDKKSKEYKRLKELFPDCDFILNLQKPKVLHNDDGKHPSVLQFLAKGINEGGTFISEKPLSNEVYKLLNKLTDGKWEVEIYIIQTYSGEGTSWTAYGNITDKGIAWSISENENEDEDKNKNQGQDSSPQLFLAAEDGETEDIKLLLDRGANIESKNEYGQTALMLAAEKGNTEAVALLLDKGADIEARARGGATALIFAALRGYTKTVALLLDKGADINVTNDKGKSAIMCAEENNEYQTAKYLKEYIAGQSSKKSNGKKINVEQKIDSKTKKTKKA